MGQQNCLKETYLLHERADQIQLLGISPSSSDLICIPFGSSPVKRLASINQMVESSNSLLNWRIAVWSVGINQIDIIETKTFESCIRAFDDMLSG